MMEGRYSMDPIPYMPFPSGRYAVSYTQDGSLQMARQGETAELEGLKLLLNSPNVEFGESTLVPTFDLVELSRRNLSAKRSR